MHRPASANTKVVLAQVQVLTPHSKPSTHSKPKVHIFRTQYPLTISCSIFGHRTHSFIWVSPHATPCFPLQAMVTLSANHSGCCWASNRQPPNNTTSPLNSIPPQPPTNLDSPPSSYPPPSPQLLTRTSPPPGAISILPQLSRYGDRPTDLSSFSIVRDTTT